ncbi:hypothetical protein M405DRAFT_843087 [Rhizopogon salebrosus TDB-379]|nr:hypothetical protein M405DRAFT_843087 [Rhizopogon salebrosus TDB-379]
MSRNYLLISDSQPQITITVTYTYFANQLLNVLGFQLLALREVINAWIVSTTDSAVSPFGKEGCSIQLPNFYRSNPIELYLVQVEILTYCRPENLSKPPRCLKAALLAVNFRVNDSNALNELCFSGRDVEARSLSISRVPVLVQEMMVANPICAEVTNATYANRSGYSLVLWS